MRYLRPQGSGSTLDTCHSCLIVGQFLSDTQSRAGTPLVSTRMAQLHRIDCSSTSDRVAEAVREMLFAGELAPGEPLREAALAETFDVARSTVREALQVLATEGLVTRFP